MTAGDATLQLHLLTYVQGGFYDTTGHQPGRGPFGKSGDVIYPTSNPDSLTVVQEVKFGGEYEAETDFAVGLSHQRPFQVATYVDNNQTRILIIDIAHQASQAWSARRGEHTDDLDVVGTAQCLLVPLARWRAAHSA